VYNVYVGKPVEKDHLSDRNVAVEIMLEGILGM
jgi:hypothetical protein